MDRKVIDTLSPTVTGIETRLHAVIKEEKFLCEIAQKVAPEITNGLAVTAGLLIEETCHINCVRISKKADS